MASSLSREKNSFCLYHVAFAGLKRPNLKEDFLFTYDGKKATGLDYAIKNGWTGKKFMDSGEYPAHKKGIRLDIDTYIEYVNEVGPYLNAICCMDYIPRESDGVDWMKISAEVTWRDYCYQRERLKPEIRDKFIYIIHIENTRALLPRALEYRDSLGMPIRYIGAGLSLGDSSLRLAQGSVYNEILKKYKYDGQVHGFGLQVKSVIEQIPVLTSCDSSSAVREQASGCVFVDGEKLKIAHDTQMHHKGEFTDAQFNHIEPLLRERAAAVGIDFDLARRDAGERFLWNCRERSAYITALNPAVPEFKKAVGLLGGLLSGGNDAADLKALLYTPEQEAAIQDRVYPAARVWWAQKYGSER